MVVGGQKAVLEGPAPPWFSLLKKSTAGAMPSKLLEDKVFFLSCGAGQSFHQALTQECSLLFVPFGRRFGFLTVTSSGCRATLGMNGQRAGHASAAFCKGWGVDHPCAHQGLDLDSHGEKVTVSQVFTVLQMTSWGMSQWVLTGLSIPT